MMKSTLLKTALTSAVLIASMSAANASYLKKTTWDVSNTNSSECNGAYTHGLWLNDTWHTNPDYCHSDNAGRHYNFDSSQSTFTFYEFENTADNYAVLDAKLNTVYNWEAQINITFDQWSDNDTTHTDGSARRVKNKEFVNGKPVDSAPGDFSKDWIFFDNYAGTINFFNIPEGKSDTYNISYNDAKPAMQVGWGADDKTEDFGASVWVDAKVDNGSSKNGKIMQDWDLNMNLGNKIIDIPEVPEVSSPAGLGIFALGLFGLAAARKRKSA